MEGQNKEHFRQLGGNFCVISNHESTGPQTADLLHRGFGAQFVIIWLLWEQLEQFYM